MADKLLGIDEAGRGAVIGPLIVAGVVFIDEDGVLQELRANSVRDSKLLSTKRRGELAGIVRKLKHRYRTTAIHPARIDSTSLNELEVRASASFINTLTPHTAFLDVPASGTGVARYCHAVEERCRHACRIQGENKMDSTNVVVSAASILAKERREQEVRKLHKEYGNFGSGYPSDPKTRKWLKNWRKNNANWPEIVRTKWSTLSRL